jgi:filamentous hemagglutinin
MAECEATIRSEVLGVPCSDFETASQSGPEALGLALLIGTGGIGDLVEALGATGDAEVSDLLASGAEADPADAGGQLTRAGRAYAKAGEVFGTTSGGPAAINEAGQDALNEILSNPGTEVESVTTGRFEGGLRFVAPDGTFVVFDQEGTLQYFARTKP